MKALARLARLAAAILAFASAGALAGGPISICVDASNNPDPGFTPLKYPGAGTVNLAYDQGNLGSRSKAQADAIVTSAVALGGAIGPVVGGVAAAVFGLRLVFLGGGILLLLSTLPVLIG